MDRTFITPPYLYWSHDLLWLLSIYSFPNSSNSSIFKFFLELWKKKQKFILPELFLIINVYVHVCLVKKKSSFTCVQVRQVIELRVKLNSARFFFHVNWHTFLQRITPLPHQRPFNTTPIPKTIPATLRVAVICILPVYSIFFSAGTVSFSSALDRKKLAFPEGLERYIQRFFADLTWGGNFLLNAVELHVFFLWKNNRIVHYFRLKPLRRVLTGLSDCKSNFFGCAAGGFKWLPYTQFYFISLTGSYSGI